MRQLLVILSLLLMTGCVREIQGTVGFKLLRNQVLLQVTCRQHVPGTPPGYPGKPKVIPGAEVTCEGPDIMGPQTKTADQEGRVVFDVSGVDVATLTCWVTSPSGIIYAPKPERKNSRRFATLGIPCEVTS